MGAPSLNLSLSFCQDNNCKTLNVTDNSDWGGSSVIVSDVTAATLVVTPIGGTAYDTIDLIDVLLESKTGTVTIAIGSRVVTGVSTLFVSEFGVGDEVSIGGNDYTIESIESNTSLTLKELAITNSGGVVIKKINKTFEITSSSLCTSGTCLATDLAWTDGVYHFKYNITAGGVTFTFESYKSLICQVDCCVISRVQEISEDYLTSPCDNDCFDDVMKSWMILDALKSSSKCGSSTEFTKILTALQQLCQFNGSGCSCCD